MKRSVPILLSSILLLGILLGGCTASDCSEYQVRIDEIEQQNAALISQNHSLETDHETLNNDYIACNAELTDLQADYDNLMADYESKAGQLEAAMQSLQVGPNHATSRTDAFDYYLTSPEYFGTENQLYIAFDNALKQWEDACGYYPESKSPANLYRAIWLYHTLMRHDIDAVLVLGDAENELATFETCDDFWVLAGHNPSGEPDGVLYWALNPMESNPIIYANDHDGNPIEKNNVYFNTGYLYVTPDDLLTDIAYRWFSE